MFSIIYIKLFVLITHIIILSASSDVNGNSCLHFNFKDILPKCRNEFISSVKNRPHGLHTDYSRYCAKFYTRISCPSNGQNFNIACMDILYYLNYINNNKSKDDTNPERSCKYFFYKIKDLFKKFPCMCNDPNSCYGVMKSFRFSNLSTEITSLFSLCNDYYPNDLNEDIFRMLKELDILYEKYNTFLSTPAPNASKYWDFRDKIRALEKHQSNYNTTFRSLLENFNNNFVTYLGTLKSSRDWKVTAFLQGLTEEEKTIGVLTVAEETKDINRGKNIETTTGIDTNVQMYESISADSGTQIST
ncbi:variable surface protein, partial [Plasmodium gonderi]